MTKCKQCFITFAPLIFNTRIKNRECRRGNMVCWAASPILEYAVWPLLHFQFLQVISISFLLGYSGSRVKITSLLPYRIVYTVSK